jgi:hypothetical protein
LLLARLDAIMMIRIAALVLVAATVLVAAAPAKPPKTLPTADPHAILDAGSYPIPFTGVDVPRVLSAHDKESHFKFPAAYYLSRAAQGVGVAGYKLMELLYKPHDDREMYEMNVSRVLDAAMVDLDQAKTRRTAKKPPSKEYAMAVDNGLLLVNQLLQRVRIGSSVVRTLKQTAMTIDPEDGATHLNGSGIPEQDRRSRPTEIYIPPTTASFFPWESITSQAEASEVEEREMKTREGYIYYAPQVFSDARNVLRKAEALMQRLSRKE